MFVDKVMVMVVLENKSQFHVKWFVMKLKIHFTLSLAINLP